MIPRPFIFISSVGSSSAMGLGLSPGKRIGMHAAYIVQGNNINLDAPNKKYCILEL